MKGVPRTTCGSVTGTASRYILLLIASAITVISVINLYHHHVKISTQNDNITITTPLAILYNTFVLIYSFWAFAIAASDFFCPNLAYISDALNLSESVSGVTLAALGNGASDLFSTYSAFSVSSPALALGELVGSACFIVMVVVGSVLFISQGPSSSSSSTSTGFRLPRRPFLRDIGFFLGAIALLGVIISDGEISLFEAISLIAYYWVYVLVVVVGNLIYRRMKRNAMPVVSIIQADDDNDVADQRIDENTPLLVSTDHNKEVFIAPLETGREQPIIDVIVETIIDKETPYKTEDTLTKNIPTIITDIQPQSPTQAEEDALVPPRPISPVKKFLEREGYTSRPASTPPVSKTPSVTSGLTPSPSGLSPSPSSLQPHRSRSLVSTTSLSASMSSSSSSPATPNRRRSSQTRSLSPSLSRNSVNSSGAWTLSSSASMRWTRSQRRIETRMRIAVNAHNYARFEQEENGEFDRDGDLDTNITESDHNENGGQTSHNDDATSLSGISIERGRSRVWGNEENEDEDFIEEVGLQKDTTLDDKTLTISASSFKSPQSQFLQSEQTEEQQERYADASSPPEFPSRLVVAQHILTYIWTQTFPFITIFNHQNRINPSRVRQRKLIWRILLGVLISPLWCLLSITIPVDRDQFPSEYIEDEEDFGEEEEVDLESNDDENIETSGILINDEGDDKVVFFRSRDDLNESEVRKLDETEFMDEEVFNKIFTLQRQIWHALQLFFIPVCFTVIVTGVFDSFPTIPPLVEFHPVFASIVVGLISSLTYILVSTLSKRRFESLFSVLGFIMAMVWIYVIAGFVVGCLKSLGDASGLSESILGLTVFSIGNSVGDLITNLSIAKMGFPTMSIGASFGGPMLNVVLGVGISTLAILMTDPNNTKSYPLPPLPKTLYVSSIALVVTLVVIGIIVPLNGFKVSRWIGVMLLIGYGVLMVANVVVEVNSK